MCALFRKKMVQDVMCPWCGSTTETDTHVLLTCGFARTVWAMTGMERVTHGITNEIAFDLFIKIFDVCTKDQCVQIGMITWGCGTGEIGGFGIK